MKTDTDSVGYCRIRIWNRIEKINKNRIRMYPLSCHIKFEYGYEYLYWCFSGYGYQIIRISATCFPSLHKTTKRFESRWWWWFELLWNCTASSQPVASTAHYFRLLGTSVLQITWCNNHWAAQCSNVLFWPKLAANSHSLKTCNCGDELVTTTQRPARGQGICLRSRV